MTFCENVTGLVQYGIDTGLLPEEERIYAVNRILEVFGETEYEDCTGEKEGNGNETPLLKLNWKNLENIMKELLDYGFQKGLLKENSVLYRDLFDTRIMDCLTPRPAQVTAEFWKRYAKSPKKATDYYYKLSQDCDYIRRYRIEKDLRWKTASRYGEMDLSINLSKPEKDPKAIAAAAGETKRAYPKCQLCVENAGYPGRIDHPARQNLRVIPIPVNQSPWAFQYSPYVYFNEHCIVLNSRHVPMKMERDTFVKLFDFVKLFPHYFLGSNADLPIVGGSILTHDHYQGGNYTFAMEKASVEIAVTIPGFEEVEAGIVKWPLSVLRLRCPESERLIDLAAYVLERWRAYTDEAAEILAQTDGTPHNTVTPIARKSGDCYELDLTLRNNRKSKAHPWGIFHPHEDKHHIKKENIGLIEVMGLAVLPARLQAEFDLLAEYIVEGKEIGGCPEIAKHKDWVKGFLPDYRGRLQKEAVMELLKQETGKVFTEVLEDAGVFKCTPEGRKAFLKFIRTL